MPSLFDLESELLRIKSLVELSEDGELPEEVVEWLDRADGQFDQKVEAWASVIGEISSMVDARSKEIERIRSLRDTAQKSVDRMKSTLRDVMTRTGKTKVETTRYKVWVQSAGGKQPLSIPDPTAVPERFIASKLVQEVNSDAIRSALEAGECLEFASLSPRGQVLRIK